jgi:hypothetical protein
MDVGTSIQAKARVSSTGVAEPAPAGAVSAVADVEKVLEDSRRSVHAAVKQRVLTNNLEV